MATSRATLRALLGNEIYGGRFTSLTTTSAGDAGGTTLVDTGAESLPNGGDDDFCVGWFIVITELVSGGPAVGESQRVTAYVASTTTFTTVAFSAQVKTGTNYELHRYDPTDLHNALNRSVQLLYPALYIPQRNETLIVDNLLANASLDTFSTTFTSWDNIGTPTLAAETTRKVHGSGSASIAASGATEGIEQNLFTAVNIRGVVTKTLHVRGWVFATVASAVRIRVTFDGTTYTNGSWHGGDAEWENDAIQYIDVAVPADATEITISCEVTDGNTGYFDLMRAWIDPDFRYTIPAAILKGPYTLSIQRSIDHPEGPFDPITDFHVEEDSSGRYIILNHAQPPGYVMRVTGVGVLSTMSSDTAETEVDAPRTMLVVARAAQYLYEMLAADAPAFGGEVYLQHAARYKARVEELLATAGMRMVQPGARVNQEYLWG